MGLPKTQQECLLFSWEILLKKTKVIPPKNVTMENIGQDGGCCNSNIGLGSKITQFEVEDSVLGLK